MGAPSNTAYAFRGPAIRYMRPTWHTGNYKILSGAHAASIRGAYK